MALQKPATLNLCRTRGDTFPFTVVITKKSDSSALNITGFTVTMSVHSVPEPTDLTTELFKVTATIPTGTDGKAVFTLSTANADQTPGEFFHDMQYKDGGGAIRTFAAGTYVVEQDRDKSV